MGYPAEWLFTHLLSPLSIGVSCVSAFHRGGRKIGRFGGRVWLFSLVWSLIGFGFLGSIFTGKYLLAS